jgi:hypothetical protein
MASRSPLLEADLAVGRATVAGVEGVRVAVPVLLHSETRTVVWQSPEVFPMTENHLPAADKVFDRLEKVAVVEWPEMAGATDWHAWKFQDLTPS